MGKGVTHQYAPNMRRALYEGLLKAAKAKDMTLTEYVATWWEEDWRGASRALAGFMPRESKIEATITERSLVDVLASLNTEESAEEDTGVESEPGGVRH